MSDEGRVASGGPVPVAIRELMGRLSPEALHTLRALAEMKHRPPEAVLEEALRGYLADRLPLPDVEALIGRLHEEAYALGYACGSLRRFLRDWQRG